jgi:hypothetical protein
VRRVTGGARAWASLPCAMVRRTAQAALCRAPEEQRTTERSAPCVYRSRAAWRRRTAKSGLCRASDRKRPANHLAHGKGRLSGSARHRPSPPPAPPLISWTPTTTHLLHHRFPSSQFTSSVARSWAAPALFGLSCGPCGAGDSHVVATSRRPPSSRRFAAASRQRRKGSMWSRGTQRWVLVGRRSCPPVHGEEATRRKKGMVMFRTADDYYCLRQSFRSPTNSWDVFHSAAHTLNFCSIWSAVDNVPWSPIPVLLRPEHCRKVILWICSGVEHLDNLLQTSPGSKVESSGSLCFPIVIWLYFSSCSFVCSLIFLRLIQQLMSSSYFSSVDY